MPPTHHYPDDANIEQGQFFCKHCNCVFVNKFNFKRHISQNILLQQDNDDLNIHVVNRQYNTWCYNMKQIPAHCSKCFTIFTTRCGKSRHKCTNNVHESNKTIIDELQRICQDSFQLLNGRISDRTFKNHITFATVYDYYGLDVLLESMEKQSLAHLVHEVFLKPKHNSLYVIRYDHEEMTFVACEYDDWKAVDEHFALSTIFENSLSLVFQARAIKRIDVNNFLNSKNISLRTEFWLEDLDGGCSQSIKVEKQRIRDLFIPPQRPATPDRLLS